MFLLGRFNILMFGFLLRNLFFLIVLMKDIRGIERGNVQTVNVVSSLAKQDAIIVTAWPWATSERLMKKQCQWTVKEKNMVPCKTT